MDLHQVEEIIDVFEAYINGVPLPTIYQDPKTLNRNRELISSIAQDGHGYDADIFYKLMERIQKICLNVIQPKIKGLKGHELFQSIADFWEKFKFCGKILAFIFTHLDNYFIPTYKVLNILGRKVKSQKLYDLFLDEFRLQVFINMKEVIHGEIIRYIGLDRAGEWIDTKVIKSAINLFDSMKTPEKDYYKELEKTIVDDCRKYYTALAKDSIQKDSVPEYLIKCDEAYKREKKRVQDYLKPETLKPLEECLDDCFLKEDKRSLSLDLEMINETVEKERKYQLDAAIIIIMRDCREMSLQDLLKEVSNQITSFKPYRRDILVCIEDLINREYLRRDDDRPNDYFHYVG